MLSLLYFGLPTIPCDMTFIFFSFSEFYSKLLCLAKNKNYFGVRLLLKAGAAFKLLLIEPLKLIFLNN
jgi:hypothetical protein